MDIPARFFLLGLAGFVSSGLVPAGLVPIMMAATPPAKPYTIQTVAGNDLVGDGGPALAAILSQTEGIAVYKGTIYIADADDNRIRKITPDGNIQTMAGTGAAGFSGDGGPADAAMVDHPYGLAVDAAGNLFIADLGNARVRKISINGTIQTVAGGGLIPAGTNGDNIPALSVQFVQPHFGLRGQPRVPGIGGWQSHNAGRDGQCRIYGRWSGGGYCAVEVARGHRNGLHRQRLHLR